MRPGARDAAVASCSKTLIGSSVDSTVTVVPRLIRLVEAAAALIQAHGGLPAISLRRIGGGAATQATEQGRDLSSPDIRRGCADPHACETQRILTLRTAHGTARPSTLETATSGRRHKCRER